VVVQADALNPATATAAKITSRRVLVDFAFNMRTGEGGSCAA